MLDKKRLETEKLDLSGRDPAAQSPKQSTLTCPECTSQRLWRDGVRRTSHGEVQRWLCRDCGFRFSESTAPPSPHRGKPSPENEKNVNIFGSYLTPNTTAFKANQLTSTCQVCVSEREAKNLINSETREKEPTREDTAQTATVKGKILEFLWTLKKEGVKENSARTYAYYLENLASQGASLLDPESVKETIADKVWSEKSKALAVTAYTRFLNVIGGAWKPPRYRSERKLPYIPSEKEIDSLISTGNKKMTAYLQLLKETGMRSGEAWRLRWIDVDLERNLITLNTPEKGGRSRMFKISPTLTAMLNNLPKKTENVFTGGLIGMGKTYRRLRKRVAYKLQNPRLLRITFHTFRHWMATMEYHKTKDILHVMERLGHKSINTTLIYTQLVNFESDCFHSATAKNGEEANKLIEAGFDYVCTTPQNIMLFRKRR